MASCLRKAMPELHFIQRRPRTALVSWQWSTNQYFLPFAGVAVLQMAQRFSWAATIVSYVVGVRPYFLSFSILRASALSSGLVLRHFAFDSFFVFLRCGVFCLFLSASLTRSMLIFRDLLRISRLRSGLVERHFLIYSVWLCGMIMYSTERGGPG